jgi:predicted nucleotidyltransferase
MRDELEFTNVFRVGPPKSLVDTLGAAPLIAQILKRIEGIDEAYLYGSFASNQQDAASDIDVLVIGSPREEVLAQAVRTLERQLGREINYTVLTPKEFGSRRARKDAFHSPRTVIPTPRPPGDVGCDSRELVRRHNPALPGIASPPRLSRVFARGIDLANFAGKQPGTRRSPSSAIDQLCNSYCEELAF